MDSSSMAEPGVTYRLPDWLGGHEVVNFNLDDGVYVEVSIDVPTDVKPSRATSITLARSWLVEVRPPSIDDPEPLPVRVDALKLEAWTPEGDSVARISIEGITATVWQGLEVPDLRRLARAAWQRANAVEAGERV